RVAGGDEARERREDALMVLRHQPELDQCVADGAAEPMLALLLAELALELGRRRDAHAGKVDEVARDDQPPRLTAGAVGSVPLEQPDEISIPPGARRRALGGVRAGVVHQIATQMNVGKDQEVMWISGHKRPNPSMHYPPANRQRG